MSQRNNSMTKTKRINLYYRASALHLEPVGRISRNNKLPLGQLKTMRKLQLH